MSLEKLSNILLVVFTVLVGSYFIFQDRPFMEPVHSHLEQGGSDRIALYIGAAVVLLVVPQMIQSITRKARDMISTVRSVTEHGVEGWAHVKKGVSNRRKAGKERTVLLRPGRVGQRGERVRHYRSPPSAWKGTWLFHTGVQDSSEDRPEG